MGLNDYNRLAQQYKESDIKPYKQYSILPTVLKAAGDLTEKAVLDLGCGSGFFSRAFAQNGASKVTGIDNSEMQIKQAQKVAGASEEYRLGDAFNDELPMADIVNVPFILNYLRTEQEVVNFLKRIRSSLNEGGAAIFVIDLPSDKDLTKYGAVKIVEGAMKDGAPMKICLYNADGSRICELNAYYISPSTFERCSKAAGFDHIERIEPIVSEEGINAFTKEYWEEYLKDTQLGYYLCS